MGHVRPFVKDDILQVADLHAIVFETNKPSARTPQNAYASYFLSIFLENPLENPTISSLVYEESDGSIQGFLGTLARPFLFERRIFRAALSSQFIVHPKRRSTLAGVELLRAFLSGPQDLSLTDEADDHREDCGST